MSVSLAMGKYITKEEVDRRREAVIRNNPFNWKNGFNPIDWWWAYLGQKQVEKRETEAVADNFFAGIKV